MLADSRNGRLGAVASGCPPPLRTQSGADRWNAGVALQVVGAVPEATRMGGRLSAEAVGAGPAVNSRREPGWALWISPEFVSSAESV